ncbi:MAG: prepilin peptidase [Zhaonellaceae bacterium]|jgi:leader peptidase (prepilin peptidase)/N-methyltransferase
MLYALFFIFGLIIGSFLNVCIYRIPRGKSVVHPPSYCESCGTRLKPLDIIPVASWLFLHKKCRYCGTNISSQYPLVELLTAVLFVFIFHYLGLSNSLLPYLLLTSLLIIISFIDFKSFLVPNKLIISGLVLGFGTHLISPTIDWQNIILGFLVGGGVLYVLAILSKGGIGGGDIKLAAMIGFYLGWQKILQGLFLGALIGSIFGLVMIITKKATRNEPIPFAPFLSLGVILTLFLSSYGIFY